MVLNQSDIEMTAGTLGINNFSAGTTKMLRHHCEKCGTAIWFSSPDYADIVALKPGTLDDTSTLRPIAHMWYRSAQPWLTISEDVPVYQEQPEFSELVELGARSVDSK